MAGINKVLLMGNLGRDPEVRYTQSGSAVANFSIATNRSWKDKQGNRQEHTEWHNVVAWGPKAEFVQNYLKKGSRVFIEGRLQTRDWTDNQNVRRFKTEIVANDIQFMDRASDSPGQGGQPSDPSGPPAEEPGGEPPPEDGAYLEDDIPF